MVNIFSKLDGTGTSFNTERSQRNPEKTIAAQRGRIGHAAVVIATGSLKSALQQQERPDLLPPNWSKARYEVMRRLYETHVADPEYNSTEPRAKVVLADQVTEARNKVQQAAMDQQIEARSLELSSVNKTNPEQLSGKKRPEVTAIVELSYEPLKGDHATKA